MAAILTYFLLGPMFVLVGQGLVRNPEETSERATRVGADPMINSPTGVRISGWFFTIVGVALVVTAIALLIVH